MEHVLHSLLHSKDTAVSILLRKPLGHIKVLAALVAPMAVFLFINTVPYNPFRWILGQAVMHDKAWAKFLSYLFLDGIAPLYIFFAATVSMIHMLNQLAGSQKTLMQDFSKAFSFMRTTWYAWALLIAGMYVFKYSDTFLPGFLDTLSPLFKWGFVTLSLVAFTPFVISSKPVEALKNSAQFAQKDIVLFAALTVPTLLIAALTTYIIGALSEMIIRGLATQPPKTQILINGGAMDILYVFLFALGSVSVFKALNSWHS
jgi:hypothetical protein